MLPELLQDRRRTNLIPSQKAAETMDASGGLAARVVQNRWWRVLPVIICVVGVFCGQFI
jgi:hypothetical protein